MFSLEILLLVKRNDNHIFHVALRILDSLVIILVN